MQNSKEEICMKHTLFFLYLVEACHGLSNFVAACVVGDYGQAFGEAVTIILQVLQIAKRRSR